MQNLLAALTAKNCHYETENRTGKTFSRCPAHDDQSLSLEITQGNDSIFLKCFGGCAESEILAALGLDRESLDGQSATDSADAIRERFPRLDIAALLSAERPPREWIVPGLIPAGASVALIAPAGTGKSLFLLAAMISVARGDATFAGLPIPKKRRVVLVDAENTENDLADRFTAFGITTADVGDLDALIILHLPPLAALDTATGGAELAAILSAYEVAAGDVVVLDSLQRVIAGKENDSDTMRAYYRHTAIELKRRGITTIRTDNTGKDTEKGARGSSGKRDDVDIELILTRDADFPERLSIKPGKSRMPDIEAIFITREIDEDGKLSFSSAGDPFRQLVSQALEMLHALDIPLGAGEKKAAEIIKASGKRVVRTALRAAIKERKNAPNHPKIDGAPPLEMDDLDRANDPWRSIGAGAQSSEIERENHAEHRRRTDGAGGFSAQAATAPVFPLSIERGNGAGAHPASEIEKAKLLLAGFATEIFPLENEKEIQQ